MINLWISGQPKTKGSLDQFHQDSPASKRWRQMMGYALGQAKGGTWPAGTAVAVRAQFFLPTADVTTPNVGDLDKLARNLLDAGERPGQLYVNDVQVVRLFVDKWPAGVGPDGLAVTIWAPTAHELTAWEYEAELARGRALLAAGLTS